MKKKGFNLYSILYILIIILILNVNIIFNRDLYLLAKAEKLFIISLVIILQLFKNRMIIKYKNIWKFLNYFLVILSLMFMTFSSINILNLAFIYLYLLLYSFFINNYTKLRFEIDLGISIASILLLLFILSILNFLKYSKIIIIAVLLILFINCILLHKKNKKNIFESFNIYLEKGILVYSILFIICILNGFERYVNHWDEYNMWGLNAKKIIYSDSIKGFTYPPIIAIWHYFVSLFDSFKEPTLYISNALLIYSYLMILFTVIKEKYEKLLMFIIIITFPYLFGNVYNFNNLYADFSCAAICGYILIFSLNYIKTKKDNLLLILLIVILTLTKPQSFVLTTSLLCLLLLKNLLENLKWKFNIKIILKNILKNSKTYLILLPLLIYIVWTIIDSNFYINKTFITYNYSPLGLSNTFIDSPDVKTIFQFLYNIFKHLNTPIIFGILNISIFNYFIITNLIIYLCYKKIIKNTKESFIKTIPFMLVFIIFYLVIALSLLMKMPIADALNLASFDRYLDNYFVGLFIFIVYFIMKSYGNKERTKILLMMTIIIILSVPFNSIFSFITDIDSRYANRQTMYKIKEEYQIIFNKTKSTDKIYIIDQEDKNGYLPLIQASYYLYPRTTNANGQINWRLAVPSYNNGWEMTGKELEINLLKNKFDYIYFYSDSSELYNELDFMFENEKNTEGCKLYKINRKDNKIKLTPVVQE